MLQAVLVVVVVAVAVAAALRWQLADLVAVGGETFVATPRRVKRQLRVNMRLCSNSSSSSSNSNRNSNSLFNTRRDFETFPSIAATGTTGTHLPWNITSINIRSLPEERQSDRETETERERGRPGTSKSKESRMTFYLWIPNCKLLTCFTQVMAWPRVRDVHVQVTTDRETERERDNKRVWEKERERAR